ncbi:MAG: carbohydrate binding domain-containing protein [Planctomycetota bacterium]
MPFSRLKPGLVAAAVLAVAVTGQADAETPDPLPNAWLNIHGVGWDGPDDDPGPILRLARGLGYRYNYHGEKYDHYEGPHRADLFFYYNDPHKQIQTSVEDDFTEEELAAAREVAPYTMRLHPMIPRAIDEPEFERLAKAAPRVYEAYKNKLEATKSWANTDQPFPHNLAQLQIWGDRDATRWEPCPDYQRDEVIDEHVAAIVAHVKAQERPADAYLFKGVVFDVPEIWKEFNWASHRGLPGTPDEARTAVARPGVEYDYATLQEGWYHFLDRLHDALEDEFPQRDTKIVHEPAAIWADWGQYIADIPYESVTEEMMDGIRGDAMVGEKPTLEFLTQQELAEDGWPVSLLGNVTGDLFPKNPSFTLQLVVFGECAARGSNFFAYGTFAREFERLPHTYGVDLNLLRIVAGWENSNATPVDARLWDYENRVYLSPTAVADEQSLAAVNPYTGEIQGTLRSADAAIKLADGVSPTGNLRGVNAFFEPVDGEPPVVIEDGLIKPKPGVKLPLGFRLQLDQAAADGVYFSHPEHEALVHRPQKVPYILREVHNTDFELGPEGWYTGDGRDVRVVAESDVVRSGELSGKLIARTKAWHSFTQRIPDVLNIHGPGTYRITGYVRQSAGSDFEVDSSIHVMVRTAAEGTNTFSSSPVRLKPGEWVKVSAELDINFTGTAGAASVGFRIDHPTMPYFLDDVTFDKID